jgi:hypothetical protein
LGVDLKLAYNSKFWEHAGGTATLAERNSWVGVGWSLLVGRVIDDSANGHYYVTLSDGSNHDLTYYGGAWRSRDSSYMIYDPAVYKLTLKGGLKVWFDCVDTVHSSMRWATRVKDTNGNYLDIGYSGAGGRISNIQDTLGNTYTFVLNSNNRLWKVQYPDTYGVTRSILLNYQAATLSFGPEPTDSTLPPQYALQEVIYPSGGISSLRYVFSYLSSGELTDITLPTCGHSRYFYSTYQHLDRLTGSAVHERLVTGHDTGAGSPSWSWNYQGLNSGTYAPYFVRIAVPNSSPAKFLDYSMQRASNGWADGFLTATAESNLSFALLSSAQDWTQDDESLTSLKNPRVAWTTKTIAGYLGPDKTTRTEFTYAPATDYSGNLKETREYSFANALRRKTTLAYLHEANAAYVPLNI